MHSLHTSIPLGKNCMVMPVSFPIPLPQIHNKSRGISSGHPWPSHMLSAECEHTLLKKYNSVLHDFRQQMVQWPVLVLYQTVPLRWTSLYILLDIKCVSWSAMVVRKFETYNFVLFQDYLVFGIPCHSM